MQAKPVPGMRVLRRRAAQVHIRRAEGLPLLLDDKDSKKRVGIDAQVMVAVGPSAGVTCPLQPLYLHLQLLQLPTLA